MTRRASIPRCLMSGCMYPTEDARADARRDDGFVSYFLRLPPAVQGTVRLFDRQDFFAVYGDDAVLVADIVFKTQSVLRQMGSKASPLVSCTLNMASAKAFLRDALTARQLRIEIWAPTGDRHTWAVARQASPGNLQEVEDLLFLQSDVVSSPIVMALRVKLEDGISIIGAAFADATNRHMGVAEYTENDLFSNSESLIIQLGVKECLVPADDADYNLSKLRAMMERCGCVITQVKRGTFTSKSIEEDVQRLLPASQRAALTPECNKKVAMSSAAALLSYLGLLSDESNFGRYTLKTHDLSEYLRLDHAALRALNLFPDETGSAANKNASLFGLLNRCKTAQGVRMLSQWIKQPLVHVHAIQNRQALLQTFLEDADARQRLQEHFLKWMPDMLRISKRFQRGVATLEDVVRCYQAVGKVPGLLAELASISMPSEADRVLFHSTFVAPLDELQHHLSKLVEMVEMTLDLDELAYHNYVIKPDFDDTLRTIRTKLDTIRDQLDEQHAKAGHDLRLDTEKKLHLENHSSYGYCFRVTRTEAGVIKNRTGYLDLGTVKGGLYFTTPKLRELNSDFRSLSDEYARTQSRLVRDVIEIAASYAPPLEQLNIVIAHLDVVVSLAFVSSHAPVPYTRPNVTEGGALVLAESRHPCLEAQDEMHFIPNDVRMEPGTSDLVVITGPNMGGKSTYLRQIGLITLMAQMGCYVPAAEGAQVPVSDCILARVGASDSQLRGVSTFMAEMLETATILKSATSQSLVLIDELGRGTSTYDGFGLAWAISEYIATQIRCKCVFATHFHELTTLAQQQQGVQNLHVVAHVDDQDITLLYKVQPGTSDQSYGIQIAELADFPPSVIRLAKRKADELEGHEQPMGGAEEGAALVNEFVSAYRDRVRDSKRSCTEQEALQSCMDEFDERLRSNAWVTHLLEHLS